MIIGINGYIGSGKDTVGKIIQELIIQNSQDIKCKYADLKVLAPEGREFLSGWEIKKFAGKLKEIASLLTGIPVEKFEDQEFKKTILGEEWKYRFQLPRESLEQENIYYEERDFTVREFLQKLGTEAIRNNLHQNAWVNALFADYYQTSLVAKDDKYLPNWIITDTRFPNEAKVIKERGGYVIRINRPEQEKVVDSFINKINETIPSSVHIASRHPSETSLDDWKFDYIIDNNSTLEELVEKTKQMLVELKIHV